MSASAILLSLNLSSYTLEQEKAICALRKKLRHDGKQSGLTITIPPTKELDLSDYHSDNEDVVGTHLSCMHDTIDEVAVPQSPTLSDSDSLEFDSDAVSLIVV